MILHRFSMIILFGLCLNQLSNEANDSTKTKSYYLKILDKELSEEINDNTLEIAKIYQNIGEIFLLEEKLDSAQIYFNLAEDLFNKHFTDSRDNLIRSLKKLSDVYSLSGDFNKLKKVSNQIDILNSTNEYLFFDSLSVKWDSTLWIPLSSDTSYSDSSIWVIDENPSEQALDLIDLTNSYVNNGLYTEAINSFNKAIGLRSSILDSDYFLEFFSIDENYIDELIDAIHINNKIDTLNLANNFLLSLCYNQKNIVDSSLYHLEKHLEVNDKDVLALIILGNFHTKNKDWYNSLEKYQEVVWIEKNNLNAINGVAYSLYNLKNYSNAILGYEKILTFDPYHYESFYHLGKINIILEDYDKAISNLTQALMLNPENDDIYYNLGIAYLNTNRLVQAMDAFNRSVKLNFENGKAHYNLGIIHEGILKTDKAIQSYKMAKKYSPDIADINYRLGMLLYKNEEFYESMEPLREYIIHNPDSISVLKVLGDIFINETRFQESINVYERLTLLYPFNYKYLTNLAYSHYKLGNIEKAYDNYKAVLEYNDEDAEIYKIIGEIAFELRDYKSAIFYLKEAINCGSYNFETLYTLGISYASLGKYMQALIALEELQNFSSENNEIFYQKGIIYFELELYEYAIENFIKFSSNTNDDALVYVLIGKSFVKMKKYQSAITSFEESLKINSQDYRTLFLIGEAYYNLNNYSESAKSFRKALKINPDDAQSHLGLGLCYFHLNKTRSMKKELNILKMLDPILYDSLQFYIDQNIN